MVVVLCSVSVIRDKSLNGDKQPKGSRGICEGFWTAAYPEALSTWLNCCSLTLMNHLYLIFEIKCLFRNNA